jgi:hypothetical protein
MTLQELSQNITLHRRLATLEKTFAALTESTSLGGQGLTGMPRGTDVGDPTYAAVNELENLSAEITRQKAAIAECEVKINAFLLTIDDSIIRVVLRLRVIECLPWREVARAAGYQRNVATVRTMVYRYIEAVNAE